MIYIKILTIFFAILPSLNIQQVGNHYLSIIHHRYVQNSEAIMTCGLSQDELDIPFYLYQGRCLNPDHTIGLKAIERDPSSNIKHPEEKLDVLV